MAPIENGGFIVSFNREGFGTLDINEIDNSIKVKLFNINPLKNESQEMGENFHPLTERFNDGKCSPDGIFFAGTIDMACVQKDG